MAIEDLLAFLSFREIEAGGVLISVMMVPPYRYSLTLMILDAHNSPLLFYPERTYTLNLFYHYFGSS